MEHKFQVHLRGIIDLLSNHLYSGPEVFVRELLQNAVDAIRARAGLEPGFSGEVMIEPHARRGRPPTLVFADTGVGLTEEEVHRFLATIGESSKRASQGDRPTDFIGQFGVGLLSCFVVSDEVVVITRSARPGGRLLEWRGRADGTYSLTALERDMGPGTQVYLTCKPGCEEYFEAERVRELAGRYGGLLPFPVRVSAGKTSVVVNAEGAPWRRAGLGRQDRTRELLRYGREVLGANFLDAVPLRSKAGDIDGVAFVLPHAPSPASRPAHRVYLKNMLLSEHAEGLLPDWAFFVRAVVNANDLRPTASRESFYEDDRLDAARAELGECLRDYLMELAGRRPEQFRRILEVHHLALRALAAADDECYRLFIDWLPFETSLGEMTLAEYRRQHDVIRWVADRDQFRQIARVAAAQRVCVVNGGYVYDADLLARYPEVFPEVRCKALDPADLAQSFGELDLDEQEAAHGFLTAAEKALRPFRVTADLKKFQPAELPALYSTSREGQFLRSLEQSREVADPLWAGVLDSLGRRDRPLGPHGHLCFNHANPLVRRLLAVADRALLQRAVQTLYVQALLLGHHPLSAAETRLLNEGLLALIERALEAGEGVGP